jgi:lactate 2-monooxygenase
MVTNFGDFQNGVYAEAVHGVTTRYPFDFASIERKASEALPDWVYRYVSAAAGDGRTSARTSLRSRATASCHE